MKRRTYLKTILRRRGHCCRRLAAAPGTCHPIARRSPVDPAKEKEMLHNFETIFRPAAVQTPGIY